jgi:hypothetical protein
MFLFFCFCSSSRCFLESPSAPPRLLPVVCDRSTIETDRRPAAPQRQRCSDSSFRSYRRVAVVRHWERMLDTRSVEVQLLPQSVRRLACERCNDQAIRRSLSAVRCAQTHNSGLGAQRTTENGQRSFQRCGNSVSGLFGEPFTRISKYSMGAPWGPAPIVAMRCPAATASPSRIATDCVWPYALR